MSQSDFTRVAAAIRHLSERFHEQPALDEVAALADLEARWPGAELRRDDDAMAPLRKALEARFWGRGPEPLAVLLKGTAFQLKVWEALLAIPEGRVLAYGDLAALVGDPGASRAVGTAVGRNPVAWLIPCHRVIQATGQVGSYHWGTARKRAILALEWARTGAPVA